MRIKASITRTATLGIALLAAAACSDDTPTTGPAAARRAQVNLQVSSFNARVGDRVTVGLHVAGGPGALGGIQGSINFDQSRLQYLGQIADDQAIAIVNERAANAGSLRFGSFRAGGIGENAVTFVFAVKAADYARGLSYMNEVAAANGAKVQRVPVEVEPLQVGSAVAAGEPLHLTARDWVARLGGTIKSAPISARPGEIRPGLMYGDVNFDNAIDLVDYVDVANTAVGNREIIVGTDGPTTDVDRVIAGNVGPKVGTGACGVESDGSRVLDLVDYLAIALEAAGGADNACVGTVIPGREAVARPDTVLFGTAADTTVRHNVVAGDTLHLTNDRTWLFDGVIDVLDGAVLQIDPGTTVKGGTLGALFIERGGKIIADGTYLQPITLTCQLAEGLKTRGCWRGVFLAGRAHVNAANTGFNAGQAPGCPAGTLQAFGEGNAPIYGGCTENDNSGIVRYVVIEYAGRTLADGNENNGLTLGGVGNGTTIDYVQIHRGQDDGVEFFGGSFNVKHLLLTANFDDQFDWSFGYNGDAQFVITQVEAGNVTNDSKAMEGDNSEPAGTNTDSLSNNQLVRTTPNLWNFTMIGNLATTTTGPAAIHLRRGNGSHIANALILGYPVGLQMTDASTCSGFGTTPHSVDNGPWIKNSTFAAVANLGNDDSDAEISTGGNPLICPAPATGNIEFEEAFILNEATNRYLPAAVPTHILVNPHAIFLPDWRMKPHLAGDPIDGTTLAPPAGHPFLENVNYRGAVAPATVAGAIPWYSGWTRPWQTSTTVP